MRAATNGAGLTASCAQGAIALDTTAPPFPGAPPDIVVESAVPAGAASAGPGAPRAADAADADPHVYPRETGEFGMGENEVTWFARDASVNTSYATQKVMVRPPAAP